MSHLHSEEDLVEYGFRRIIITITAVLCALLEVIDTTIVNVALNDMKGNLGVTLTDISWVITAYAIANVIIIPMTSWLSNQFGRRNYFAVSIIIFTASSFFCGTSTSLWELVFFRVLQGLGGGALLATGQTIITESYPVEKRGLAMAIYGMGIIVGPTLGPPLGGYIVDNYSWPFIFYINIPIGILATIFTIFFVRSPKYGGEKLKVFQVDWIGILLLIIWVGSLQYVLEHGQQDDWFNDTSILGIRNLSIISFFGLIFFLWRELTYKYPVVNLRVLRNSSLASGTILSFVLGFGLYASVFIVPVFTQSILGWTAFQSGVLLIPGSIMTGFMMPIVGVLIQKGFKQKLLVSIGFLLFFIYSYMMYIAITPQTGGDDFFYPLFIRGIGLGLLFVPITTLSLSALKGAEVGDGASMTGMMRQLGGSFGIAIVNTYLARSFATYRSNLVSHLNPSYVLVQERIQGLSNYFQSKGYSHNESLLKTFQILDLSVNKQATIQTFMDVFLYLGILFLVCIPFVLLIKEGKNKVDMSNMH